MASLMPVYFREPSGQSRRRRREGRPPHIIGKDFSEAGLALPRGQPAAYALSTDDFEALAQVLWTHRGA